MEMKGLEDFEFEFDFEFDFDFDFDFGGIGGMSFFQFIVKIKKIKKW